MEIKHLHILLADDDEDDCEFFQEALDATGINVFLTRVSDGRQLMCWLKDNKNNLPDWLFLEIQMPFKNGYECLEEFRKIPDFQLLPVVIYSTVIYHLHLKTFYHLGVLYYIQKPAVFEELVTVTKKVLSLSQEAKQIQPPLHEFIITYR